jgi:hypothetical protein
MRQANGKLLKILVKLVKRITRALFPLGADITPAPSLIQPWLQVRSADFRDPVDISAGERIRLRSLPR